MDSHTARSIPSHFGIAATALEPADSGLINRTFVVTDSGGTRYILQWVNPLFSTDVNRDIDAVTAHVAMRGLLTPRLLPTTAGDFHVPAGSGHWRMMTWIDGVTVHKAETDAIAREAGRMLGKFHLAVSDFTHSFASRRPGVHDTARHLSHLRSTLRDRVDHPRHGVVAPLGAAILDAAAALPPLPPLSPRVVHGDPKISNVLFDRHTGAALCMVDLDTVSRMALPLELGDALRSWCNLAGEDQRNAEFSPQRFSAALEGYADGAANLLSAPEIDALIPATRLIYVELAARFCADALNEDYFAWDPARFGSHSEHSEVRAAGQLDAARAMTGQLPQLQAQLLRLFPPGHR